MGLFIIPLLNKVGIQFLVHGAIELLGLFIGAYIGFTKWDEIVINRKKYTFLLVLGAFLIIVAGILEGYVTPIISK